MQNIRYQPTDGGQVLAVPLASFIEREHSWLALQRSIIHSLFVLHRMGERDALVEAAIVEAKNASDETVELLVLIYNFDEEGFADEQFQEVVQVVNDFGLDFQRLGWRDMTQCQTYPVAISLFGTVYLSWVALEDGPAYFVLAYDQDQDLDFFPVFDVDVVQSVSEPGVANICLIFEQEDSE